MATKRVAFLATGEEIINGDIQDTNATYFAQHFIEQGIQPGRRVTVGDHRQETENAIRYLLADHDALITIGGLGPTSDDLTRFAVADALGLTLTFDEQAWQWVEAIYLRKGLVKDKSQIPSVNRQQALFPVGATAIENTHGTAAACHLSFQNKEIFMLPGPPNECRPIFQQVVLPLLLKKDFARTIFRESWLLLGASESTVAAQLDPLMTDTDCQLGYRVYYPYLEIKLWSSNKDALTRLAKKFEPLLQDKVISKHKKTASQQLQDYLAHANQVISIHDEATNGALQNQLISPHTLSHVRFGPGKSTKLHAHITGLVAYWQGTALEKQAMSLLIAIENESQKKQIEKSIFYRGDATIPQVVEVICWTLLQALRSS